MKKTTIIILGFVILALGYIFIQKQNKHDLHKGYTYDEELFGEFNNINPCELDGTCDHTDQVPEAIGIHPSWDINQDGINDCEMDGTCDHVTDYSQSRTETAQQTIEGDYTTATGVENEYYQTIAISPKDNAYLVEFSATNIKGEPGCSLLGVANMKDGRLLLEDETLTVVLQPTTSGIMVETLDPSNKELLGYYCAGGATLAGEYKKS